MRRAKIVCTLGPATSSAERIKELVEAGMDVARLNMSHGTQDIYNTFLKKGEGFSQHHALYVTIIFNIGALIGGTLLGAWSQHIGRRKAIVIASIFSIIGSFQLFNEPNILRTLAPNIITTYFTPNMYAYNLSFAGQQYNASATVAIVIGEARIVP